MFKEHVELKSWKATGHKSHRHLFRMFSEYLAMDPNRIQRGQACVPCHTRKKVSFTTYPQFAAILTRESNRSVMECVLPVLAARARTFSASIRPCPLVKGTLKL